MSPEIHVLAAKPAPKAEWITLCAPLWSSEAS
jgi:hypothetical protein